MTNFLKCDIKAIKLFKSLYFVKFSLIPLNLLNFILKPNEEIMNNLNDELVIKNEKLFQEVCNHLSKNKN